MSDQLCIEHTAKLDQLETKIIKLDEDVRGISVNLFGGMNKEGTRVAGFCNDIASSIRGVTRVQKWMTGIFTAIIVMIIGMAIKFIPAAIAASEIIRGVK